jgi:hypothetical protein
MWPRILKKAKLVVYSILNQFKKIKEVQKIAVEKVD